MSSTINKLCKWIHFLPFKTTPRVTLLQRHSSTHEMLCTWCHLSGWALVPTSSGHLTHVTALLKHAWSSNSAPLRLPAPTFSLSFALSTESFSVTLCLCLFMSSVCFFFLPRSPPPPPLPPLSPFITCPASVESLFLCFSLLDKSWHWNPLLHVTLAAYIKIQLFKIKGDWK